MSHSTVRLGNGKLDAVTELHRVNLSPENRFEASPLRGNSTATGTFRREIKNNYSLTMEVGVRGRERTARRRRRCPDWRAELLGQANRMSIGANRVDLRSEDEHGILGGV